jgi:hypothetical protein
MSIDASLGGPLHGPRPVISQPNPPSPTSGERTPMPSRLRQAFPPGRPQSGNYEAGPSRQMADEPAFERSDRDEARERFRREDRQRRRTEGKRRVTVVEPGEQQERESAPRVELTQSQELKEYEEQMWDAQELRTAQRMDHREQLRQENRRRQEEEDRRRRMAERRPVEDVEDLEELETTRRLAEMAVDDGIRQRQTLEEEHLNVEKAVLEQKVALANMRRRKAAEDAAADEYRREDHEDRESARLLRSQIEEGREREAELRERRRDRLIDLAQGRRKSSNSERKLRAQELRERIESYERHLEDLEAQILQRTQAERERQKKIAELEEYIESLDRKIEARQKRASMMGPPGAPPGAPPRRGERRSLAAAPERQYNPFAPPPSPLDDITYRRNRGKEVLERDRQSAMAWDVEEGGSVDTRVPAAGPLRRRDTIGGQYRAREKAYRDPSRT